MYSSGSCTTYTNAATLQLLKDRHEWLAAQIKVTKRPAEQKTIAHCFGGNEQVGNDGRVVAGMNIFVCLYKKHNFNQTPIREKRRRRRKQQSHLREAKQSNTASKDEGPRHCSRLYYICIYNNERFLCLSFYFLFYVTQINSSCSTIASSESCVECDRYC